MTALVVALVVMRRVVVLALYLAAMVALVSFVVMLIAATVRQLRRKRVDVVALSLERACEAERDARNWNTGPHNSEGDLAAAVDRIERATRPTGPSFPTHRDVP